jgi:N-acetylglucosaminyl-diphospho-decaprenol L-rhamnosyltransferase
MLTASLIESCLRTAGYNLPIIVVDNSPDDPKLEALKKIYPTMSIIQSPRNIGYGAACNLGLDHIESKERNAVVWILNPDARLLPGAIKNIEQLVSANPHTSIFGTRICNFDGQTWFEAGLFNRWLGSFPERSCITDDSQGSTGLIPTTWVSGCSMILNLAAFSSSPRFDPRIFLYYEDVDLCLRLRQQGHPVYVTRSILVEHAISQTTAAQPTLKFRHATFGKLFVLHQHASALALILNLIYFVFWPSLRLLGWPQISGRLQGISDYLHWLNHQIRSKETSHPRPAEYRMH